MSLFSSRPKDPLEEEMRRLQAREKELARQVEKIQHRQNTEPEPPPSRPLVVIRPEEENRPHTSPHVTPGGRRLRVEHRKARTRFVTACILLAVLALVIYRVWRG